MGVDVHIEDENGNIIKSLHDPQGLVNSLMHFVHSKDSCCLRFIDPYGDTTFNHLQIPELISELEEIMENLNDQKIEEHANKIIALSQECLRSVHLYLSFYGD